MTKKGTRLLALIAAVTAGGAALLWESPAYAQHGYCAPRGYQGVYRGYGSYPTWHRPSVHYDTYYHPTARHYTPYRGWHTHGHYDVVPHYVPGHYDRVHNGHLHPNRRYH